MIDLQTKESRYDRQELITWWDQSLLGSSRVLVVGAGALGNELVKNLALLGVGHIHVVDMDEIEHSNLARGVFFREASEGSAKARVVAEAAADLNPDVEVGYSIGSITTMGLGFVDGFDLIVAGLDNREARAWINQAARKLGKPWIDGAIEGLRGTVRVFLEEGPCYECTLGEVDRKIMAERKSCALLTVEQVLGGKTPTTATSASVIAAVQVQEAVKILQGRRDLLALRNQAFVFLGETLETYVIDYSEDEYCLAHDRYGELVPFSCDLRGRFRDLLPLIDGDMSGDVVFETEDDIVIDGRCLGCIDETSIETIAHQVVPTQALCSSCGEPLQLEIVRSFTSEHPIASRSFGELAIPTGDVVTIRDEAGRRMHFMLGEVT